MRETSRIFHMERLKGQVALITGANAGIGEAVARAMAAEGAHVAVNYTEPEQANEAQRLVHELRAEGYTAIAVRADVGREDEVRDMFSRIVEQFGRLDILVNHAAIRRDAPLLDMSLSDWEQVLQVNLTGAFLCAREAARIFIRQGWDPERALSTGVILFIGATPQELAGNPRCNYDASKGGLHWLMQSVAQELAPHKIRVNSILPGAIKTPMNRSLWADPAAAAQESGRIPLQRLGEPEDVAAVAVWLASDEAGYIEGGAIPVNGGMNLGPGLQT